MKTDVVERNMRADALGDAHEYVCQKISTHRGPVPRRVMLSEIQTDAANPFNSRSLHRDLMSVLCNLESMGIITVGPTGLKLSAENL